MNLSSSDAVKMVRSSLRFSVLAVFVFLGATGAVARAGASAPWMHRDSPFRAIFEVENFPSSPQSGILLKVPVCRLGESEGKDVFVYNQSGHELNSFAVGAGRQNKALVLVRANKRTSRIYAYFGSGMKAPQARMSFRPSLQLNIRTRPEGGTKSWEDTAALIDESESVATLFPEQINLGHNPVDSRNKFIMVFNGYFKVRKSGTHSFFLVHDDAGYLFIDGERLISRSQKHAGGAARRGKGRTSVELAKGMHSVKVVVVNDGGRVLAVLAQWLNKEKKHPLQANAFSHPGTTVLTGVESRDRGRACPAFRYELQSYMNYKGTNYTKAKFVTYNGRSAEWRFGDGARAEGAEITRILVGMGKIKVALRQEGVKAGGYVRFPEDPPTRRRLKNAEYYREYARNLSSRNMETMTTEVLQAYRRFFRYIPYNARLVPVCYELLQRSSIKDAEERRILLDLAQSGSVADYEKGRRAYERYLEVTTDPEKQLQAALQYAEFALFGMRDSELAERIVKAITQRSSDASGLMAKLLKVDLALQREKNGRARKLLSSLTSGEKMVDLHRQGAVKSRALKERYYQLLEKGFLHRARQKLWEWQRAAPYLRGKGHFAVARARLWRRFKWYQGALADLDAAERLTPLLPNLPEVLYVRAQIRKEMGDTKRARRLLRRIVKEFPNHPDADKAQEMSLP